MPSSLAIPRSETAADTQSPTQWSGAPLDLADAPTNLFEALYRARRQHGGATEILQDGAGPALTYDAVIRAAWALGGKIARFTAPGERVGVLLPTAAPAVVTVFALSAIDRVPALLNFTAGTPNVLAAADLAGVRCVLTSRRFVKLAGLKLLIERLSTTLTVVFLEDLRAALSPLDKLIAGVRAVLPLAHRSDKADRIGVILFTSGTTGAPKGVALSHANLIANIAQCRAHIPFDPALVFFNALPLFHAFGLTGGALLPLVGGMKAVLHPSPLDHERIPKLIRQTGANVLISTDSFARMYARAAEPSALDRLRYVVLGGETVHASTLAAFAETCAARVLQGYGATECGPVISINQPEADRPDTVGRLLPGMEARLEPMPGTALGDRLLVRGPNVMAGYLDPQRNGAVRPRGEDWFDTGDLARIDPDGFISVTGRAKRFAKIGGEMVALPAVEAHAAALWPDARHAALATRGAEPGERIVLVTEQKGADRLGLAGHVRAHGASPLEVPHQIFTVRRLPVLPTGKPDLGRIARMIERKRARDRRAAHRKTVDGSAGKASST